MLFSVTDGLGIPHYREEGQLACLRLFCGKIENQTVCPVVHEKSRNPALVPPGPFFFLPPFLLLPLSPSAGYFTIQCVSHLLDKGFFFFLAWVYSMAVVEDYPLRSSSSAAATLSGKSKRKTNFISKMSSYTVSPPRIL